MDRGSICAYSSFRRSIVLGLGMLTVVAGAMMPTPAFADRGRHCDTRDWYQPRPSYGSYGNGHGWNGTYLGGSGYNSYNGYHGYHGYNGYNGYNSNYSGWNGSQGGTFNAGYWDRAILQQYREGDLSRDELRKLQQEKNHIQRDQERFLSDGRLSPREREHLRDDVKDFRADFRHQISDDEYR